MPLPKRLATAIFTLIGLWALFLSIVVALIDMPSLPWRPELKNLVVQDASVQHLVFIFVGFLETLIVGIGITILTLTYGPYRAGQRWSVVVLVMLSLTMLLPQLVTWYRLGNPWWSLTVVSVLIGLTLLGGFLGIRHHDVIDAE